VASPRGATGGVLWLGEPLPRNRPLLHHCRRDSAPVGQADLRARIEPTQYFDLAFCWLEEGARAIYHPDYYGAYVLDPDGNNIEVVCHQPE
jgi:hypothetical protein